MSEQEIQALRQLMLEREIAGRARLFRELVDRFGAEVLEIVEKNVIEEIRERLQQAKLDVRNLDTVMEILWNQLGDNIDFTVEEQTPENLRLKVTRCFIAEEMRARNAADVGLAFYCAYDDGFCQGLNPAIKFTRTKTLMAGDDCCNHTYELRDSGD